MFDLGPDKILVILVALFIFLGPKELPAAARTIGEGMRKLRALQDTVRSELGAAIDVPTDHAAPAELPSEPDTSHRSASGGQDEREFPEGPSSFS
jgi:Sec-independent protein translocase protein TatA